MTIEQVIEQVVRRVVREELDRRPGADPRPELVKLAEVRRWVQVSPSTLKKLIREGLLMPVGAGRLKRVRLEDVEAALERRRAPRPVEVSADVQRILSSIPGGRR